MNLRESSIMVANMVIDDWEDVSRIYLEGISSKNATFETTCPDWPTWDKNHRADCRLVAKIEGKVVGWSALSSVSGRCVYAGVCEVSVYVDPKFKGKGIGSLLLDHLIEESEKANIWTLQAGIFPENTASIKLHHNKGFRTIGIREKIGKMDNVWRDVMLLERRSKYAGVD